MVAEPPDHDLRCSRCGSGHKTFCSVYYGNTYAPHLTILKKCHDCHYVEKRIVPERRTPVPARLEADPRCLAFLAGVATAYAENVN